MNTHKSTDNTRHKGQLDKQWSQNTAQKSKQQAKLVLGMWDEMSEACYTLIMDWPSISVPSGYIHQDKKKHSQI
jgi:hypothetical protein